MPFSLARPTLMLIQRTRPVRFVVSFKRTVRSLRRLCRRRFRQGRQLQMIRRGFWFRRLLGPAQDLTLVQAMGYDAWLQQQFNLPPTYSSTSLVARQGLGETLQDDQFSEAWWGISVTAPDQLRQRVAFALSEIFVISQNNTVLTGQPLAVADYYDMLIADAFSNYRQILEDVTLHPAMGNYLNMLGNRTQYTNSSGQPVIPNENYAPRSCSFFPSA